VAFTVIQENTTTWFSKELQGF